MPLEFHRNTTLLFVGDSITDCGRRTDELDQLGNGYVRMIRDWLRAKRTASAPKVVNEGISGNRITHLRDRWERDVLAHHPDIISIKIGINDVWHGLGGGNEGVSPAEFETVYRALLHTTRAALPNVKFVLCEPSVIWPPAPEVGNAKLKPYVAIVNSLKSEPGVAAIVPLHSEFETAKTLRPDIAWAPDGVHPSSSGHALIAKTWLESVGLK